MTYRAALAGGMVVLAAATPGVCLAQLEASLDAGTSYVKYDGYLGSGAAFLTPAASWRSTRGWIGARGTALGFESGNTSLQGLLSGGAWSPPLGPLRAEAALELGASSYTRYASFQHILESLRIHALGRRRGVWVGPVVGSIAQGGPASSVMGIAGGTWIRLPGGGAASVTLSRQTVGDTAYSDAEARLRWRPGRVDVEAAAGTRFASRAAGRGAYGDLSATFRLGEHVRLVLAGGRYPSDPLRGSIPGGFVTLGVRFQPAALAGSASVTALSARVAEAAMAAPPAADTRLRLAVVQLEGLYVLTIHAPGARRVELMGDFTDWQPIGLTPVGAGQFQFALRLAAGLYRFNVRADGRAWTVPQGADVSDDEFGGSAAVLVVP